MGDIDKSDSQFVFQADQLILHILAQLQIKAPRGSSRRRTFGSFTIAGNGDPLLLSAA